MGLSSTDLREIKSTIIGTFTDKFLQEIAQKVAGMVEKQFEERLIKQEKEIEALQKKTASVEKENERLRTLLDDQEQSLRSNNIRIFGMDVTDDENLFAKVKDVFIDKLKVPIQDSDIKKCYRVANKIPSDKPPAVLVKFSRDPVRVAVLKNRKKIKNSGIQIREDLTKCRLSLFSEAVRMFSNKNSWVLNGVVYVKVNDQVHRIPDVTYLKGIKNNVSTV